MNEKKVSFKNSNGNNLFGHFFKSKSKSLLISCHGLHSYNYFPGISNVFDFYHKLGFSVLRFDFSGYGESEGRKSVVQRIDDIKSAIKTFKNGYKEIIISAQSLCAIPAVIAATENKNITKLIFTNGLYNFEEINPLIKLQIKIELFLKKSYREEKEFFKKNFKPENIKIPTLIIYSDHDRIVNPKQSIDFYNELKTQKTLGIMHNADHYPIKKENINEGFKITELWFKKYNLPR